MNTINSTEELQEKSKKLGEDFSNSYNSYKREPIENTPFLLETDEDKGWRIGLGHHGITEWNTDETAYTKLKKEIIKTNWHFLTTTIAIIVDRIIEHKTAEAIKEINKNENENEKIN